MVFFNGNFEEGAEMDTYNIRKSHHHQTINNNKQKIKIIETRFIYIFIETLCINSIIKIRSRHSINSKPFKIIARTSNTKILSIKYSFRSNMISTTTLVLSANNIPEISDKHRNPKY